MREYKGRLLPTDGRGDRTEQPTTGIIIPFKRPVKPRPAPTPAGFDHELSGRLDLLTFAIEEMQAEKRSLEQGIPDREAMA